MGRVAALVTQHSALITLVLALASVVLYWLLWTPAYRLNERFEYSDLLFGAFPWIADVLAAQLRLVGALLPAAVGSYQGTTLYFVALLLAQFALYTLALAVVRRAPRRVALGTIFATTLAFQFVLLPLPGVFTTDLFSYAMYGEIAGRYGASPYVEAPHSYPTHPLYLLINPLWRDAPSVYGPLWIALSSLVGATLGGQVLAEVLVYRLVADLCHWANLGLLWWTLRRLRPGAEPLGLALYAWNPLIVFEFAANGHNDGTMLLFVLACFGWLARGRAWLGVAALVLSMATKYTTVVLFPLVLWWAVRDQRSWTRRLLVATGAGLLGAAVVAALYLPWWRGLATLGPVIYWVSTPLYANYAPIGVAGWVRDQLAALGWAQDEAEQLVFGVQRLLVRIVYLTYLAAETLRFTPSADRPPPLPVPWLNRAWDHLERWLGRGNDVGALALAAARALLVFLLAVNTWVLPWYYTWPVALVALGNPRSRTTWVVLGFSLSAPLSMYWAQAHFEGLEVLGFVVYLAPLAALALWEGGCRMRARWLAPHGTGARTLNSGGRYTTWLPGSTSKK